jgi:hypothetical protein
VTQRLLWWWNSTGRPGYLTRLLCYATRFTSSSVTSSSIWAASARIVPCGPDQPCDRARYSSDFLAALMKGSRIVEIVRESLTIGGWVSMWRPLEIFLYDWWPIRSESRLSERLAAMLLRIRCANATAPDAWGEDWPAVSPRGERATSEAQPRPLNQAS